MPFTKPSVVHHLNPTYFGCVEDLLDKSVAKERDTLMIACFNYGTEPNNVSFPTFERMAIPQHLAALSLMCKVIK